MPHFVQPATRLKSTVWGSMASFAMLVLFMSVCCGPAQAQTQRGVTADEVKRAIDRGVDYLKRNQLEDGTWPDQDHYDGGLTPLCVLALLQAGYGPDDPAVRKGLEHVFKLEPRHTYYISIQTMIFCFLDPVANRGLIERNVRWLEGGMVRTGDSAGMWAIPERGEHEHIDNSMTHFAILALYEAERHGIAVSPDIWKTTLDYWQRVQNSDGSWGWGPEYPGTGSMTCAGITSIIIASGQLGGTDARILPDGSVQCGLDQTNNAAVDRALNWLVKNFSVARNPAWDFWRTYYLYSLERAGRLTTLRFIGPHDWYREGAAVLVREQYPNGGWPADLDFEHADDPLVASAFSVLFLAKARRPVVMGHVQYQPKGTHWNPHRSSIFNFVTHLERVWRRELTHQIIDLQRASVEDLLEAPVLFISGREAPNFSEADKQKLRMYVDRGGFIFAENCCGGKFDTQFRQLLKEIFHEPEAALRSLPPSHPAWFAESPVVLDGDRDLLGIDVGCRTGVIYANFDLSCYWELGRMGRDHTLPTEVRNQVSMARAIGANIMAYATNREVKFRDPAYTPASDEAGPSRGRLQVARAIHSGGCDAAPQAVGALMQIAEEKYGIPSTDAPVNLRLTDPKLFSYHLLFFSGRTAFSLTPEERNQLRVYLERGGTVFADAVGSSREFAQSFRREMKLVLEDHDLQAIPLTDALFSDEFGGEKISTVQRRRAEAFSASSLTDARLSRVEPVLEGIKLDDRFAVIFSPYDVSCALESDALLAFEGYHRPDAIRLAINILLYSLLQ